MLMLIHVPSSQVIHSISGSATHAGIFHSTSGRKDQQYIVLVSLHETRLMVIYNVVQADLLSSRRMPSQNRTMDKLFQLSKSHGIARRLDEHQDGLGEAPWVSIPSKLVLKTSSCATKKTNSIQPTLPSLPLHNSRSVTSPRPLEVEDHVLWAFQAWHVVIVVSVDSSTPQLITCEIACLISQLIWLSVQWFQIV